MRCIFCKEDSSSSVGVEHIIPESLGNTRLTLRPGVVCDKCNNYFSQRVEKPFMEHDGIKLVRFQEGIPSKKNKIPSVSGLFDGTYPAVLRKHKDKKTGKMMKSIDIPPEAMDAVLKNINAQVVFPVFVDTEIPRQNIMSRFLAKMALELVALRAIDSPEWLEYIVDDPQFDPLRFHARQGKVEDWPYLVRRIYDIEKQWIDSYGNKGQAVHESDILVTDRGEWYFVVALFGLEFSINIGGPDMSGYFEWLKEHNDDSPLHVGKNRGVLKPF